MKEKDGGESSNVWRTASATEDQEAELEVTEEGKKRHNGQTVWTCLEEGSGMFGEKVAGVGSAQQDA